MSKLKFYILFFGPNGPNLTPNIILHFTVTRLIKLILKTIIKCQSSHKGPHMDLFSDHFKPTTNYRPVEPMGD